MGAHRCHEHNAGSCIEQEGRIVLRGNSTVKATNGVAPEKVLSGRLSCGDYLGSCSMSSYGLDQSFSILEIFLRVFP